MPRVKITDSMLLDAIKISFSFKEVLRVLGLKEAGGSHSHYSKKAKLLNADTTHFLGQRWNKGKSFPKKRFAENILIDRTLDGSIGGRQRPKLLVSALLEIGVPHCCSKCKQEPEWLGFPLTLDVDHINENWLDDRAENLRFLCPNCHSQFSRHLLEPKKLAEPRKYVAPKVQKPCKCCGTPVKDNSNEYCSYLCTKKSQELNEWSSIDLVRLVDTDKKSFVALSKVYNVSDNTIKKWYLKQKNSARVEQECS